MHERGCSRVRVDSITQKRLSHVERMKITDRVNGGNENGGTAEGGGGWSMRCMGNPMYGLIPECVYTLYCTLTNMDNWLMDRTVMNLCNNNLKESDRI